MKFGDIECGWFKIPILRFMFLTPSPPQVANLAGFVVGLSGIQTFCSKLLAQESE